MSASSPRELLEQADLANQQLPDSLIRYMGVLCRQQGTDAKLVVEMGGNVRRELTRVLSGAIPGFCEQHSGFQDDVDVHVVTVRNGEDGAPENHYFDLLGEKILPEVTH